MRFIFAFCNADGTVIAFALLNCSIPVVEWFRNVSLLLYSLVGKEDSLNIGERSGIPLIDGDCCCLVFRQALSDKRCCKGSIDLSFYKADIAGKLFLSVFAEGFVSCLLCKGPPIDCIFLLEQKLKRRESVANKKDEKRKR